jgi:hypothetical protein
MEHRDRLRAAGASVGEGFVFTDTRGGPLRASNVLRASFFPLLQRAGLPCIRFHDLRLGLHWVFTVKENQPDLVAEVERLTNSAPTTWGEEPTCRWARWHLPEVYWTTADRTVRMVKTVRTERKQRLAIRASAAGRRPVKEPVCALFRVCEIAAPDDPLPSPSLGSSVDPMAVPPGMSTPACEGQRDVGGHDDSLLTLVIAGDKFCFIE